MGGGGGCPPCRDGRGRVGREKSFGFGRALAGRGFSVRGGNCLARAVLKDLLSDDTERIVAGGGVEERGSFGDEIAGDDDGALGEEGVREELAGDEVRCVRARARACAYVCVCVRVCVHLMMG